MFDDFLHIVVDDAREPEHYNNMRYPFLLKIGTQNYVDMIILVLQFKVCIPCDGGVTARYSVDSGAVLLGIKYRDSVPWSIDTRYSVPGTNHP